MSILVRDVMVTQNLPTLRPEASMRECVLLLAERRGTAVVVDEAGMVLGVVTAGDLTRLMERRAAEMADTPDAPDAASMDDFGSPENIITPTVDVSPFVDRKRAAMAAHASQIPPESFFLAMPVEAFGDAFGAEWFMRRRNGLL